jgi:predicted ATP-dependent protease
MNGPLYDAEAIARQREREADERLRRARGHAQTAKEEEVRELHMGQQIGVSRDRQGLEVDPAIHDLSSPAQPKGPEAERRAIEEKARRKREEEEQAKRKRDAEGYRISDYKPEVTEYRIAEYKSIYD